MPNIHFDCENCGPMNQACFNLQEYDKSKLYEQCFVKCSIINHLDITIRLIDLKEATNHVKNLDHKLFWSKLIEFLNNNKQLYFTCDYCRDDVFISAYCEGCGDNTYNLRNFLCEGCEAYKEHQQ